MFLQMTKEINVICHQQEEFHAHQGTDLNLIVFLPSAQSDLIDLIFSKN